MMAGLLSRSGTRNPETSAKRMASCPVGMTRAIIGLGRPRTEGLLGRCTG